MSGARTRMTLRRFEVGDDLRFAARMDFVRDRAGKALPDGPKLTVWRGDVALGVAGFYLVEPGHWGAWAYMSDLRPREWVQAAALARRASRWAMALLPHCEHLWAIPAESCAARRLLKAAGYRPKLLRRAWLFDPETV